MSKVVFRLINGKTRGSYTLKGGTATKNGKLKTINYYPGSDSIYDEDNRKFGIRARPVVFHCNNNKADMAVEIVVDESNKVLIDYLKARKEFGKVYAVYDVQSVNKKKVANFNQIEQALQMVSESEDLKTKAIAVAVLGFEYYNYPAINCSAALKEMAIQKPHKIIAAFGAIDYESRYIAALAFIKNILKPNETSTAVVWSDTGGKIVTVAPGEDPLSKLVEFIQNNGKQAEALLQEIGMRIELPEEKVDPKDAEIAKLKAELNRLKTSIVEAPIVKTLGSEVQDGEPEEEIIVDEADQLKEVRAQYKEKFGKPVPTNKSKDLEWIKLKLFEE